MAETSGTVTPWREFLDKNFPSYLQPAAMRHALDPETAAHFLRQLHDRDVLDLLRRSSLIAARAGELEPFCRQLADLVRVLPSRTEVERRVWDGGFHGRLALGETMAARMAGAATRFVTNTRTRSFDTPENQLVRAVAERLLTIIASLRKDKLLKEKRWGGAALACEDELYHLVHGTILREVLPARITGIHEQAASTARHACYKDALAWHRLMKDVLDERNDQKLAKIVAEGALEPCDDDKKFEVAVLIKLIQKIESVCDEHAGEWIFQRSIVRPNCDDIARFSRERDGACIKVYYNKTKLLGSGARGPRERGVHHYFERNSRIRPDITIVVERSGQQPRGVVFEIKHSNERDYLIQGYQEALLYRHEYADHLIDWPKAVLVCAGDIPGAISTEHEVIAVDWRRWAPREIVAAIVPPLA